MKDRTLNPIPGEIYRDTHFFIPDFSTYLRFIETDEEGTQWCDYVYGPDSYTADHDGRIPFSDGTTYFEITDKERKYVQEHR